MNIENNYIYDVFSRIRLLCNDFNFNIIKKELEKYKYDDTNVNYFLNINEYPEYDLFTLFYKNNTKNEKLSIHEEIASSIKCSVFKISTLQEIVSFYNNIIHDDTSIEIMNKHSWSDIEINTINPDDFHICLFNNNSVWLICDGENIYDLDTNNDIINIFNELNTVEIDTLNIESVYHFNIRHNKFLNVRILYDSIPNLTLKWICDKQLNLKNEITDYILEKIYYMSCLDELQTRVDIINVNDKINKKISSCGCLIKIRQNDRYILCGMYTYIYKYIKNIIPKNNNQYINFIELYQKNMLPQIIPYIYKYSTDAVSRINKSIKVLSKEILNIYHLTRKRQNHQLYENLPDIYKQTINDIHKIFEEDNNLYSNDRKTITIHIVYNHVKNLNINKLVELFLNRYKLFDCINNFLEYHSQYDNILITDNIEILTQIELLK